MVDKRWDVKSLIIPFFEPILLIGAKLHDSSEGFLFSRGF